MIVWFLIAPAPAPQIIKVIKVQGSSGYSGVYSENTGASCSKPINSFPGPTSSMRYQFLSLFASNNIWKSHRSISSISLLPHHYFISSLFNVFSFTPLNLPMNEKYEIFVFTPATLRCIGVLSVFLKLLGTVEMNSVMVVDFARLSANWITQF